MVLAVVVSFVWSSWALVSIPFIWLGALCAQPNLNLADGCLAYLAVLASFVLGLFHPSIGLAIGIGTLSAYCLSVIEKTFRMRPYNEDKVDAVKSSSIDR